MINNYWIASQLFFNKQNNEKQFVEKAKQSILKAKELMGLDCLIIYPAGVDSTENVITFCRDNQVETYLWFPIFADAWDFEPRENELLLQVSGKRGAGSLGAWSAPEEGGEDFQFVCPNNPEAVGRIFSSYEYLLDRLDFDGVMLDRIRYPSCVSGFESLFACFCEHCKSKFEKQYGYSLDTMSDKISRFVISLIDRERKIVNEFNNLEALLNPDILRDLISFKKQNILERAVQFSQSAKKRGLTVGLDLYSPTIAPTVFQDYSQLGSFCDWIKPMLYCYVNGPAGLPLEIGCLWQAIRSLNPGLGEDELKSYFERCFKIPLAETKEELLKQGVPEKALKGELGRIGSEKIPEQVKIYPGIEAVSLPALAVDITPGIIEKYMQYVKGQSDGIIASWNITSIPEENMKRIGSCLMDN